MTLRAALFFCLSLPILTGCAGSPDAFVAPNAQIGEADVQRIYLATDRVLGPDLSGTTQRGGALSFAQYDITIPPGHTPGEVEYSARNPDPRQSFTVLDAEPIGQLSEFGARVRGAAGPLGRPIDGTVIFVHGFNTSMESAVYRPMITGSWVRRSRFPGPPSNGRWAMYATRTAS